MYKPDSVSFSMKKTTIIYLASKSPLRSNDLPFLSPKGRDEQPQNKIYLVFQPVGFVLPMCYHKDTCALTAHFHPYLAQVPDGYFLLHFPSYVPIRPSVRWHSTLCCPDFPLSLFSCLAIVPFADQFFWFYPRQRQGILL